MESVDGAYKLNDEYACENLLSLIDQREPSTLPTTVTEWRESAKPVKYSNGVQRANDW